MRPPIALMAMVITMPLATHNSERESPLFLFLDWHNPRYSLMYLAYCIDESGGEGTPRGRG